MGIELSHIHFIDEDPSFTWGIQSSNHIEKR